MSVEETTVLVVGAGPVGLSMAALLGRFDVPTVVIERHAAVNPHPRARSVNVRTAEIFRQWGILPHIEAVSLPRPWGEQFVYTETLAGRELGRTLMGVQPVRGDDVLSPVPWLLSSQDQIEPIIARYAEGLDAVTLQWGHELVQLEHDEDAVTATVRDVRTDERRQIRARWMVATDGAGSRVRNELGVEMEGGRNLATLVNCHFRADLSRFTDHRPAALYWTTAPARNVFQKIDMNDRWLCQIGYDPTQHRPEDFNATSAAAWIHRSIGDADVEIDVIDVIPWVMSSTVAERFRVGRVFLAGDAAHQLPPSGGFGMNTGVQDAHNLAWKLAFVQRGWAGDALLDTYDQERRPIARYNADRSMENTRSVGRIRKLVETGRDADVADAVAATARYGNWLGMDLGLAYEVGARIADGTPAPIVADPVSDYRPCARPGHRAPHVALRRDGRPISTLDLFDLRFVLLLGADADAWDRAAQGMVIESLDVCRVGRELTAADTSSGDGSLHAVERQYGISAEGGVLVRPDGHVAWRGTSAPQDAASADRTLRAAFRTLLARTDPA